MLVLVEYCTGLICVCTALLVTATVFTVKNYWMLLEISEYLPGKHDETPRGRTTGERSAEGAGRRTHSVTTTAVTPPRPAARVDEHQRRFERYDSGATPETETTEWTGPVTLYTPVNRESK